MCAFCIPCASPGHPHRSALSNRPLPVHPLPPTSFQSLMRLLHPGWFCGTNRLKLVATLFVHFVPSYLVCFHINMNCPVCNSFVLITMRIARGVGIPLRSRTSSKALTPARRALHCPEPSNLQTCQRSLSHPNRAAARARDFEASASRLRCGAVVSREWSRRMEA